MLEGDEGEPEPEGETIVGPRGEALRLLGKDALLIELNFYLQVSKLLQQVQLSVLIVENSACWVKFSEYEEEVEEPESFIQGAGLGCNLAWVWVDDGGWPVLEEGKLQSLLIQVLSMKPLSFFDLAVFFSSLFPLPMDPSGQLISSLFLVLGAAPIMSGQLPVVGCRAPVTTRGRVPVGQRPSKDRVCAVARSKAEGLYVIWQVARIWPEPSMSGGPTLA